MKSVRPIIVDIKSRCSFWLVLIISTMWLSGCSGTYTAIEAGRLAQQPGSKAVETIGKGRYAYRFTLIDPHTDKPWPNRPYALTTGRNNHYHLPFVADQKNVYQGVSDADGNTAIFRLPVRISDNDWDLRERFGSGPNGETFQIKSAGSGKPMANMAYLLMICSTPPKYHRGYTYPNGDTAYSASEKPEQVRLMTNGDDNDENLPKSCDEPDEAERSDKPEESDKLKIANEVAGQTTLAVPPMAPQITATSTPANYVFDLIEDAKVALDEKDYAKAKQIFEAADGRWTALDALTSEFTDDYAANFMRAELNYGLAKAIAKGNFGDPCPRLLASTEWITKAAAVVANKGSAPVNLDVRNEIADIRSMASSDASKYECPAPKAKSYERPTVVEVRQLMDLIELSKTALPTDTLTTARQRLDQAKSIIAAKQDQFDNFDGYYIRAKLAFTLAKARFNQAGSPCDSILVSKIWAAKAMREPYTNRDMITQDAGRALMAEIETEMEKFKCSLP